MHYLVNRFIRTNGAALCICWVWATLLPTLQLIYALYMCNKRVHLTTTIKESLVLIGTYISRLQ